MPLHKIVRLSNSKIWGIWNLTESVDDILKLVHPIDGKVYDDITHPNKIKEWAGSRVLAQRLCEEEGWDYPGIAKDEYGKPYFNDWSLGISVSHKYPYVAVMLDQYNDVGIDVELVQERILRLGPNFMNDMELAWAKSAFQVTIVWAGKEALYKLHGRKQLIFKDQLKLELLEGDEQGGKLSGTIIDGEVEQFELHYEYDDEGILIVYSLL